MSLLAVNDLKPSHIPRVVDVRGLADNAFHGASRWAPTRRATTRASLWCRTLLQATCMSRVVGTLRGVKLAATDIIGAWQSDRFSRFAPFNGALVLAQPATADAARRAQHIATIHALPQIHRGLHPGGGGDRLANTSVVLVRHRAHDPVGAAALAHAITDNVTAFTSCSGMSPSSLQRAARVLLGLARTF